MADGELNIFEEEFWSINKVLENLLETTSAKCLLLIDKVGQLITSVGDVSNIDVPSFATLSAADFAATSQLASIIGENEFSTLFHQGEKENIFIFLDDADVLFNSFLVYELAALRKYVEPQLQSIKIDSPYYNEARRLLSLSSCFYHLTCPKSIPPTSILREFIGGSYFYKY